MQKIQFLRKIRSFVVNTCRRFPMEFFPLAIPAGREKNEWVYYIHERTS